jgi:hypothetical protein
MKLATTWIEVAGIVHPALRLKSYSDFWRKTGETLH